MDIIRTHFTPALRKVPGIVVGVLKKDELILKTVSNDTLIPKVQKLDLDIGSIEKDGFVGFYDSLVTVIPEGDKHEFFGWLLPGLNKFSFSGAYLSKLMPNKKYRSIRLFSKTH